jgi:protein ImuA
MPQANSTTWRGSANGLNFQPIFLALTDACRRGINKNKTGTSIMPAAEAATLNRLREAVARIEGSDLSALEMGERVLPLGAEAVDTALGGGLAFGCLHEVAPTDAQHLGAMAGFTLALAVRAGRRHTLWIQPEFARTEAGFLYGPGLSALGLPMERLLLLRVARPADALWAMEEGLKSGVLSAVVAELTDAGDAADLTATRRLALAARDGGGLGFLLRHRISPQASAAGTRWHVAAAPSEADDGFGGLGRTAFTLSLAKNRRGPLGRWTIQWDHHERIFSTLSLAVAEAAVDRPDRAPLVHAG